MRCRQIHMLGSGSLWKYASVEIARFLSHNSAQKIDLPASNMEEKRPPTECVETPIAALKGCRNEVPNEI